MASAGMRNDAGQIVNILCEIDVKELNGKTIPEACNQASISE